jgi:hypothetical protein
MPSHISPGSPARRSGRHLHDRRDIPHVIEALGCALQTSPSLRPDRKVINYLLKPLTDQFARAFRER